MEMGPTRTLNSQVGGHIGVLTTEDQSLLSGLTPARHLPEIAIRPGLGGFAALHR